MKIITTKTIEIIVDPQGGSQVQTKGFAGSECLVASQFIEQALGRSTDRRTTAEFFAATASQTQPASTRNF